MSVRSPAVVFGALVVGSVVTVDPSGLAPFGPSKWLVVSTVALIAASLSLRQRVLGHRDRQDAEGIPKTVVLVGTLNS